jgi:hypothetical protein
MTIIEAEECLQDVSGLLYGMTLGDLEDLVVEVKQYGLDVKITNDLIKDYENERIEEYLRSINEL